LQIPLDSKIKELTDIPYTISFVIRKRQQIDNFNELPKGKKIPERIIWDGTSDEIEDWLDHVFPQSNNDDSVAIDFTDIEG
jgi:hypothetical protein